VETLSDRELLGSLADRLDELIKSTSERLDHMDDLLHDTERNVREIHAFIEEHRPALAKGLALMSAGTRLGAWRKPKD
jgi:ABC-type transporter Mla subunit MlaD